MTVYGWLISALWLALAAYWGLAARAMQRGTGHQWIWWREIALRLAFFALVVLALRVAVIGGALPGAPPYAFSSSTLAGLIGFLLGLLGIALVIVARALLDRIDRTHPELITTGPYALVRHPIYGGMLLAMVGSAIGQSVLWLLPLLVYAPHFIGSARREETLLLRQFPERYPAYMRQTKMLLPFVL